MEVKRKRRQGEKREKERKTKIEDLGRRRKEGLK